jgi:hypothetical protein
MREFICVGCKLTTFSNFDLEGKAHIECSTDGGTWIKPLCAKCGENERYERNGCVFKLCASCSWENLQRLLNDEIEE